MIAVRGWKWIITAGGTVMAAILLFSRLGAPALWDDEATTALYAGSVWQSGDTSALSGHNVVAYQSGIELRGLKNRVIPPLPFYLAAPFVGNAPGSALAARLPFALCGLFTVWIIMLWLWQARARILTWVLMTAGLLTNVSFLLFNRQCRYYAPVILLTVMTAYFYCFRQRGRSSAVGMGLSAWLLLSANYLCYAGVMVCLAVDYGLWGRKKQSYAVRDAVIFFAIQLILGGILVGIYNPFGVTFWDISRQPWLTEKFTLFLWNWRELNSNEFGEGVLILTAAVLGLWGKEERALRAVTALVMYVTVVSVLTPQPLNLLSVAFVRYLVPVIPLCVWIAVICIEKITMHSKGLAMAVALLAFGTNVLHGGPLVGVDKKTVFSHVISKGAFRSTIAKFIDELRNPPASAYAQTAEWIRSHVREGESVWVVPGYATYPLMYHAPQAVYAWQLQERSGQFSSLPEIHFFDQVAPDYIVAFGPYRALAQRKMAELTGRGTGYRQKHIVDRYWYDLTRPELFWHAFDEVKNYARDDETITIYQKMRP